MTTDQTSRLKAEFIKRWSVPDGERHLFRIDPGGPLPEYVVVSAVDTRLDGRQTYIFAANDDGDLLEDPLGGIEELHGSEDGVLDVDGALRRAGYHVQRLDA
jgi:hypothetical protein